MNLNKPVLEIKDLRASVNKTEILKDLNLKIHKGEVHAIMGPNGSGKTTLIKSILGMVIPNKGKIEVLGENIKKSSNYRYKIDYLPQIANFPNNLKVRELIRMIKDLRGKTSEDQRLIELFKLEPFLNKKLYLALELLSSITIMLKLLQIPSETYFKSVPSNSSIPFFCFNIPIILCAFSSFKS